MKAFSKRAVLALAMAAGAASAFSAPAPTKHEFLALDEGLVTLLHVDERNPDRDWVVPVGRATPRDLQLIGDGRVLVGHDAGYTEFDLATGKVRREVARFKGVTSARRLPSGHTLLAGVDLDGAKGVVLLEIDAADTVRRRRVLPGNYVRLVRETPQGTWLLMNDTMIREVGDDGALLHEWIVPGFRHAWKAVRLPGGHTLASAGFGAFLAELDAKGNVVRRFGGKDTVPAAVAPNFYATFQLLPNGHVVVANWQGHGPGHGASGVQLLEFDRAGAIAWRWSDAERISSLQGVLILDGLDVARLHDERNGIMTPIDR
ncbi:MAG TPA: hypothetical protein VM029_20210, partial [Opitutaceae bacterium]|nr:hypothetical protein [Opitutaceae bacterium]